MIEKFEKSDEDYNTGLQKMLKTMDNISGAIQQSVGILAHLVHHQTQFHNQQIPFSFHNQVLSNEGRSTTQSSSHTESRSQNEMFHQNNIQQEDDNRFYFKQ